MMASCRENEPTQTVKLPVSVCLPVNATYSPSNRAVKRAIGDPGTKEDLLLPEYIYIFIVNKDNGTWKLWEQMTIDDADAYWHKEYYSGSLMGSGDSIYRYTREIIKPLAPGDQFEGRIYVIASAKALTFNTSLTNGTSTEEDVLNLQFSTGGEDIEEKQNNLQNIYSTPYNYEVGGTYYGSFNSSTHNVPYVNIILYHVAAKVDIKWNVDKSKRPDGVRLTSMKAQNLFAGNAYCFRPMENKQTAKLATGYERVLIKPTDEGLWWEGRSYFYTIPYHTKEEGRKSYFPLQMVMNTNGGDGAGYQPTIYMKVDTTSSFVPWLRADFNINAALTDGTDIKIID
jgi:hypothetical protein